MEVLTKLGADFIEIGENYIKDYSFVGIYDLSEQLQFFRLKYPALVEEGEIGV